MATFLRLLFYRSHYSEDIGDLVVRDVSKGWTKDPGKNIKCVIWRVGMPAEYGAVSTIKMLKLSGSHVSFFARAERLLYGSKPLSSRSPRCQSLPNVLRALFALAVSTCAMLPL